MKKITLVFVFLLFLSAHSGAGDFIKPASEDEIKCMQPYDGPQFRYSNGQKIPMEVWLEQHPEHAESYYRDRAEARKRYEENKRAGICP